MDSGIAFGDIIGLLGLMIGLQNLSLNEEQVDNLEAHLSKQDNEMLQKIIKQNIEIIDQNNTIIRLLEEMKNERN